MMLYFCALLAAGLHSNSPASAAATAPAGGGWDLSFLARPELNELRLSRSVGERLSLGFHGLRNHWPQKLELHYGLVELGAGLWQHRTDALALRASGSAGLGWANKLKGVDRLAHSVELQGELESARALAELRLTTIGARDFDRKNFSRARAGLSPFEAGPDPWKAHVMVHALYENHAQHTVEFGPMLRWQYRNLSTALYGNFKGAFSWEFAVTGF